MANVLKVTKGASEEHICKIYESSHEVEKVLSTSINLKDIKQGQIIVFDFPTSYYLLTPKEKR